MLSNIDSIFHSVVFKRLANDITGLFMQPKSALQPWEMGLLCRLSRLSDSFLTVPFMSSLPQHAQRSQLGKRDILTKQNDDLAAVGLIGHKPLLLKACYFACTHFCNAHKLLFCAEKKMGRVSRPSKLSDKGQVNIPRLKIEQKLRILTGILEAKLNKLRHAIERVRVKKRALEKRWAHARNGARARRLVVAPY